MMQKPTLAIIQVGKREESNAYIARKKKFGESIGASVLHEQFEENVSTEVLLSKIARLNADASVHGIIVQLPLPPALDKTRIQNAILPRKDVDGLGEASAHIPATARGIAELLAFYGILVRGKKVAVLGRSALVGAPTAELLQKKGAKVTVCHRDTPNTKEITRASDVIVVAIGNPHLIDASYFRDDRTQVVVDVGVTAVRKEGFVRLEEEIGKVMLKGDVAFESVKDKVSAISPVPGGVGPMTVAALFENLLDSIE